YSAISSSIRRLSSSSCTFSSMVTRGRSARGTVARHSSYGLARTPILLAGLHAGLVSTGHVDHLAVDERALVADQERNRVGDVPGVAYAADQVHLGHQLDLLGLAVP